MTLMQMTK